MWDTELELSMYYLNYTKSYRKKSCIFFQHLFPSGISAREAIYV